MSTVEAVGWMSTANWMRTRKELLRINTRTQELFEPYWATESTPDLKVIRLGLETNRAKFANPRFELAVMAMCKSGKSTMVNAWLGEEFLPATSTPETACPIRIKHRSETPAGRLTHGHDTLAEAPEAIREIIREFNANARKEGDSSDRGLELEAPVVFLQTQEDSQEAGIDLDIIDTPGPGEAGADHLFQTFQDLLPKADAIVYLLNYTRLNTREDEVLLQQLAKELPHFLEAVSKRLFFVVTQIDDSDTSSLPREETPKYVAEMIQKAVPTLRVDPARVLTVSGRDAFLARLVLNDRAGKDRLKDFGTLVFGRRGGETVFQQTHDKLHQEAEALLKDSGMAELESTIFGFLLSNGKRFELGDRLRSTKEHVKFFLQFIQVKGAGLRLDRENLALAVKRIHVDLQEVPAQFACLRDLGESWIKTFDEDFNTELERFLQRLGHLIRETIDASKSASALGRPFPTAEQLDSKIKPLNDRILYQVAKQFERFRKELNIDASRKYGEMVRTFSQEALKVSRIIESRVGKPLQVKLQGLAFENEPIDQASFERSINDNIQKIVERKDWRVDKVREEAGGFCGMGSPKRIPYSLTGTNFILSVETFQEFWMAQVQDWSSTTWGTIKALIRDQVKAQVTEVTQRLQTYMDSFEAQLNLALEQSREGIQDRQERMEILDRTRRQLEDLLDDLNACENKMRKG